jgi:hypothetical protein
MDRVSLDRDPVAEVSFLSLMSWNIVPYSAIPQPRISASLKSVRLKAAFLMALALLLKGHLSY